MTSQLRSATARANGAKSKGPKTPETRAISARNSLGHGFTARNTVLLQCEDPQEFQEMITNFEEIYQPATREQEMLVHEMVACRWRLDRYCAMETALFDDEMDRQSKLPDGPPDNGIRLGRALRSLADDSHSLSLARRYLSTLRRTYEQAYRALRELKAKAEAVAAQATQQKVRNEPKHPPAPPLQPVLIRANETSSDVTQADSLRVSVLPSEPPNS